MSIDYRRAITYARISKDDAGTSRSIAEQLAECRRVVAENGWSTGPEFTDDAISASRYTTRQRPGYQALLAELRPDDVLVVYESSRAGRRLDDFVELRRACEGLGVLLCAGGQIIDFASPADRLASGIGAVVSEHESDRLAERIRRTKRARAVAGDPPPRLGFGYQRQYSSDGTFEWVEHPAECPLVRELVDWILAGRSLYSLATRWNEAGHRKRDGKPWTGALLARLAARPSLAALRTHQRKVLGPGGRWPALISVEEHEAVVALLADPRRLTRTGSSQLTHLLARIARCGVCGRLLESAGRKKAYRCSAGCVYRREELADETVRLWVTKKILPDWQADTFLLDVDDEDESGVVVEPDPEAEQQLRVLEARLAGFVDAAAKGEVSPESFATIEQGLRFQIDELKARATKQRLNPLLAAIDREPSELWDSWKLEERRAVIRLCARVEILPSGRGKRFDPALIRVTPILDDRRALVPYVTE